MTAIEKGNKKEGSRRDKQKKQAWQHKVCFHVRISRAYALR